MSRGARRRKGTKPVDLWRPVPDLDEPEPVVPASDPSVVLRSLGPPPLPGQVAIAEQYLALAVVKAAQAATALAASADLLELPGDDEDAD